MVTKGETLDKYAQSIAKRHEEGKLNIDKNIDQLKADLAGGNCPLCHKTVEEYTSQKGNTYIANKDHSPHTVRAGGSVTCVYDWDQFNAKAPKKEGAEDKAVTHNFQVTGNKELEAELKQFDEVVSNAYIKLYDIAGRGNPGDNPKGIHITTMGLMHDYFNFRLTKALQKS